MEKPLKYRMAELGVWIFLLAIVVILLRFFTPLPANFVAVVVIGVCIGYYYLIRRFIMSILAEHNKLKSLALRIPIEVLLPILIFVFFIIWARFLYLT